MIIDEFTNLDVSPQKRWKLRHPEARHKAPYDSTRKANYSRYYYRNRDRIIEEERIWRLENPEQRMFYQSRARAKKKGLEFSITLEDIVIPEYCPALGIKIESHSARSFNSPSIDRVDNTKGYVKGNVVVISHRANTWKSSMTVDDMRKLVKFMESYLDT